MADDDELTLLPFCEKEFGIRFRKAELMGFFLRDARRGSGVLIQNPVRVKEFVSYMEKTIRSQNRSFKGNVFDSLKPQIAKFLKIEESQVKPETWLFCRPPTLWERWRDHFSKLLGLPLDE